MEYERIHKPLPRQAGGFSPAKLRVMLLGLEKQHMEEEEAAAAAMKAEADADAVDLDERQASMECSTSTGMSSHSGNRSRIQAQDDDSFDSESISSGFERAVPLAQRPAPAVVSTAFVPPFSKPTPSKWDDAQKWISSPQSNRAGKSGGGVGVAMPVPKKSALSGYGYRAQQPMSKVFVEVPVEAKKENVGFKAFPVFDSGVKPAVVVPNSAVHIAVLNHEAASKPLYGASIINAPEPAVRSVSMRDMGTEMTPIASQEPSRTETPVKTSRFCSPISSRAPTPPHSTRVESVNRNGDCYTKEMSQKDVQMKTSMEILALGQKLGKTNIVAWASRAEEKAIPHCKDTTLEETIKRDRQARAADWEEADKAKHLAKFQREEVKIQAWENHQKAKIEAEMTKIEAGIERMRAREHEKLANKLAAARRKAEEKRAAAEARRNREAARTKEQTEHIRRTGHIPSSYSCWCWLS